MSRQKLSSIYNKNYINGSFLRKELKGHFQYYRYNYAALSIDAAKGDFKIKDSLNDFMFSKNMISKKEHNVFLKYLKNYFHSFVELENLSDEEIYGQIQKRRWEIYSKNAFLALKNFKRNKLKKYYNKAQVLSGMDSLLKEIIYYDLKNERRKNNSPINRIDRLKEELSNNNQKFLFLIDHYAQLPFLLKLIAEHLLDIKRESKPEINLLLKKTPTVDEASLSDWEYLKKIGKDGYINNLLKNERFSLLFYDNYSPGIDLSELNLVLEKEFLKAVKKESKVIAFGESLMFSLNQSNFDYYILSAVKSIKAQRYTNLYHDSSLKIPFIVAEVFAGEVAASNFSGVELIEKTLYHYNYLLDKIGKHKNKNIKQICPKINFNFFSTTFLDSEFPEFKINREKDLLKIENRKQTKFREIIEKDNNLIYKNSYYDLKNMAKINTFKNLSKAEEPLVFNSIIFKESEQIDLSPFVAENTAGGIVSARELVENSVQPKDSIFYHNFLYFLTDKLITDYNELREGYPLEQLDLNNIFLGYNLQNKIERKESFPLYNKGFIAYTNSGKIVFGNRKLEAGNLKINDQLISWSKEQVNPQKNEFDFIIYTPMIENESLAEEEIDFRNYRYFIGKNRLNLVLIDNKIVVVKKGELILPSIGVVLSFAGEMEAKIKKILSLRKIDAQYYQTGEYDLSIKLESPAEIDNKDWQDILWAYGGGTILVKNGDNLVKNKEKQIRNFKAEGWFHPLSKKTQETQLQNWVRGPRTVIGITKDDKFFVATFSGRTNLSCGANFDEVIKVLNKEIGDLNWVMNLDGGASSCLALIYKNELFELNYPAVSNYTAAGMVRPVNSMIFIKK